MEVLSYCQKIDFEIRSDYASTTINTKKKEYSPDKMSVCVSVCLSPKRCRTITAVNINRFSWNFQGMLPSMWTRTLLYFVVIGLPVPILGREEGSKNLCRTLTVVNFNNSSWNFLEMMNLMSLQSLLIWGAIGQPVFILWGGSNLDIANRGYFECTRWRRKGVFKAFPSRSS